MPRYGGGASFLSQPGSLEGSFNAGRENFENRGKFNSDMATANLERMLAAQKGEREQQMHPLDMQGKQLTNEGLGITNQSNVQSMGLKANKEGRDIEKHETEMQDELTKQYGAIAGELEALPEGMRMEYINKRLGGTSQGRNLYRALELGLRNQQITLKDLPKGFSSMATTAAKNSREFIQADNTARIGADQRLQSTELNAQARISAAQAAADSRVAAAESRGAAATEVARLRAEAQQIRDKEKHDREMAKQERLFQLKSKLEAEKAKMDSGGKHNPKTFEALSVQLELQSRAEEDPQKRAELQAAADDAMQRSLVKSAAGKQQADNQLDMSNDKPEFRQNSRTPTVPPRGGAPGAAAQDQGRKAMEAQGGSDLPRPKTPAEARQLPSGTRFISPDGKIRVVP